MKKFPVLLMLMSFAVALNAENVENNSDEVKQREINEIKWSEKAVYAEVLDYMADDGDDTFLSLAEQKSMALLQSHVIEIFAKRLNMSKQDVQDIWDVVEEKCQYIEVRKGDIVRVFTYVMKDALGLSVSKPKEKDLQEYFGPKPELLDMAEVKKVAPSVGDQVALAENIKMASSGNQLKDIVPAVEPTPAAPAADAPAVDDPVVVPAADAPAVALATEAPAPAVDDPVVVPAADAPAVALATEAPAPAVAPVVVPAEETKQIASNSMQVQIPELCQKMLEKQTMPKLLSFLDSEKTYEKLIYGNQKSMKTPEDCYIVIVEKSTRKIVAILDKGKDERMNFVTKTMDQFNNYRGLGDYSAVFVQEL